MELPLDTICRLVGEISPEPFDYVDYAVIDQMGLFAPVGGQCYYAVTPMHVHPSYSFVVSFDDVCRVRIDDTEFRSKPGTFTAFSPDVPHQELPNDVPARYVAVMIDREYFESQFVRYGVRPIPVYRGDFFDTTPRIVAGLREFMSEYEERAPGYKQLLEAACLRITHLIIRQLLGCPKRDDKADCKMATNSAIEYMHRYFPEKLTIEDLARAARLSPSHFTRMFKIETGMAPIEYLLELRLNRAKRLLRSSERNVTEVALACGFNSSSYFSRSFTAKYNMSPSTYKKTAGLNG